MAKITVFLGDMLDKVEIRLGKLELSKSDYVRKLIAKDLGIKDPKPKPGRRWKREDK